MNNNTHHRLTEGTRFYCYCEQCVEGSVTIKTVLDDEGKILLIDRHVECSKTVLGKSLMYNFSLGLQHYHPDLNRLTYVIRACSAHYNFHYHRWLYTHPAMNRGIVEGGRPLNSILESHGAYHEALDYVSANFYERIEEWLAKKS